MINAPTLSARFANASALSLSKIKMSPVQSGRPDAVSALKVAKTATPKAAALSASVTNGGKLDGFTIEVAPTKNGDVRRSPGASAGGISILIANSVSGQPDASKLFMSAFDAGDMIADVNGDGYLNGQDIDTFNAAKNAGKGFQEAFETGNAAADINGDGFVSGDDFDAYGRANDTLKFFTSAFEGGRSVADMNGNGFVTGDDFDAFVRSQNQDPTIMRQKTLSVANGLGAYVKTAKLIS